MWKTFAFFSGATLQLVIAMGVFGFIGREFSIKWHSVWPTAVGVLIGIFVGSFGFAIMAKTLLGDKK